MVPLKDMNPFFPGVRVKGIVLLTFIVFWAE